ncbi:MAG: biotin/lipoyl-containing protein [bacterium]
MNNHDVEVPYIDANIEEVVIRDVYYQNLDKVKKDDLLFSVSSIKTVLDIYSKEEGYIVNEVNEDDNIEVNSVIAKIFKSKNEAQKYLENKESLDNNKNDMENDDIIVTKLAKEVASKYSIDLKNINKEGIIKKIDVLNYINKDGKENIKKNEDRDKKENKLKVDTNFINLLSENENNFSNMASELKIEIYNCFNSDIDESSNIDKGSILIANKIHIGSNTYIGENVKIKADQIWIGDGVTIDDNVEIITRYVEIDDGTSIVDNTKVGGGSAFEKESAFIVGEDCLLADCIINTTRKVSLGDRVAISPGTRLFTHHHWHNILEGGFTKFEGINIGDDVHITANCTLAPGVNIGNKVLVMANSNVNRNLPDNVIAGGNPVEIIDDNYMENDLKKQKKYYLVKNNIIPSMESHLYEQGYNNIKLSLYNETKNDDNIDVLLIIKEREINTDKYKIVININKPEIIKNKDQDILNEIRYVLRKFGIRFKLNGWRYSD